MVKIQYVKAHIGHFLNEMTSPRVHAEESLRNWLVFLNPNILIRVDLTFGEGGGVVGQDFLLLRGSKATELGDGVGNFRYGKFSKIGVF